MSSQGKLDEQQVRRAAVALVRYVERSAAENKRGLLEDDGKMITALLTMHKIPDRGMVKAKPMRIPIPNPLRPLEDCDMCMFVKDESKKSIKKMMEEKPIDGLKKVIKLQRLRTQYHEFKHRRELMSQYNLFLCDDRIMPMLTKALGSTFLRCKKHPLPIRFRTLNLLRKQVQAARESAHLVGSYGESWSVKLARTNMSIDELTANLMAGIPAAVDRMPRKWKGIKSISIVCHNTVALPIYNSLERLPEGNPKGDEVVSSSKPPLKPSSSGTVQKSEQSSLLLIKNLKAKMRTKANGDVIAKRPAETSTPSEPQGSKSKKMRHTGKEKTGKIGKDVVGMKAERGEKTTVSSPSATDKLGKGSSTNGGVTNAKGVSSPPRDAKAREKPQAPTQSGTEGRGTSASEEEGRPSALAMKRRKGKEAPLAKNLKSELQRKSALASVKPAKMGRGKVAIEKTSKRRRAVV